MMLLNKENMPGPVDIYGGKDPAEMPRYAIAEAASYLRMPRSTLRDWVAGAGNSPALISRPKASNGLLSFNNVVEAHVLRSIRKGHGVTLQRIRRALRYVMQEMESKRPLLNQDFETDGVSLFISRFGQLVNASDSGQIAMRELLEASLRRITRDHMGIARAVSPWLQDPKEPQVVEIDPRRAFGRLLIKNTMVRVDILADRFRGGDKIKLLANDYNIDVEQVEMALRWDMHVAQAA